MIGAPAHVGVRLTIREEDGVAPPTAVVAIPLSTTHPTHVGVGVEIIPKVIEHASGRRGSVGPEHVISIAVFSQQTRLNASIDTLVVRFTTH
jgi:hypothetical protein